jgi:sugar/nucleoside kinase (ribokinase family)
VTGPRETETLDVVVVGDVMVDVMVRMSGPLARGSDTPSDIATTGGGSGANVAAWLAEQGVRTAYVGRVGDDALGRESADALAKAGVTPWLTIDPERETGTCVVLVEPGGERSMLPDAGANQALAPGDVPAQVFRPGAHLHLSGYTLLSAGSRDAGRAALSLARDAGMSVSVDPSSAALLVAVGADTFLGWTRGVDLLLANREEAEVLTGRADPQEAAAQVADVYREVVVKLGGDGALWRQGFIGASAPAERVDVVDTTGAGDAFAAGFLTSWLLHPEPETALAAGNRLAARAVGRVGARP